MEIKKKFEIKSDDELTEAYIINEVGMALVELDTYRKQVSDKKIMYETDKSREVSDSLKYLESLVEKTEKKLEFVREFYKDFINTVNKA